MSNIWAMAFWKVRGQSIWLVQGKRTSGGVKQKLLHTFASFEDLSKALSPENWLRFIQSMEQAHPRVAPKWEEVRIQGLKLVAKAPSASSEQDELNKVRKALRFVARALYPGSHDPQKTIALAPELLDCLEAGLMRILGPEDRTIPYFLPNAERTDGLVERAREAFYQDSRRGIRLFREAHRYNPYDPDVLNSWGVCHLEKKQVSRALELFEQAQEMARLQLPDVDRVYSWGNLRIRPYLRATANLALVKARQGHYEEALELYLHCLERCPDDGLGARYHLGDLYERLDRLEEALRATREERGTGWVELPDAHYNGARLLFKLGRLQEARGWLLQALVINPFVPQALRTKGKFSTLPDAPVDSPAWANSYADSNRDLWAGAPQKWLVQVCKEPRLARLVEEYSDLLMSNAPNRQRAALAGAILGLEG